MRHGASRPGLSLVSGLAVLVILVVAALVPESSLAVLILFALGVLVVPRGATLLWALAAGLPVALILAWGSVVGSQVRTDLLDCGNPLAPAAMLRLAEAATVGFLILLLARRLGVGVRTLGLRRPTRGETTIGILAIATIPVAGLLLGGILAEPFFGPMRLHLATPLAVIPALALAVANGTMEELAYRGALMSWLGTSLGPRAALAGQAIVFGAAHTGSDYVASGIPVIIAVAVAGLIAGLIARRTGSLLLPIVVHICFDIPLFYALACRLP